MPHPPHNLRAAQAADMPHLAAIYGHHVLHGTGTFETTPPSPDDMLKRWADVRDKGLPWLCAERDGRVLGFAYANWFRPREAFRFCAEDSIYIAPEAIGQGVGRALLNELMQQCEAAGIRKMVAVVGDSANAGSIGLHQAMGFSLAATLPSCGWKFDRWLDIVILERWLGTGDRTPPPTLQT
jgi:L-amino acid N-acyltransferase YncA